MPECANDHGDWDDVPDTGPAYTKREILASVEQHTGGKQHTVVEIIRYTWTPEIVAEAGYERCIRIRRKYIKRDHDHSGSESCGVPEADWPALVEAIKKVTL